jgi:hypothetical protein
MKKGATEVVAVEVTTIASTLPGRRPAASWRPATSTTVKKDAALNGLQQDVRLEASATAERVAAAEKDFPTSTPLAPIPLLPTRGRFAQLPQKGARADVLQLDAREHAPFIHAHAGLEDFDARQVASSS